MQRIMPESGADGGGFIARMMDFNSHTVLANEMLARSV
jgi:hypothetical protein